MMGSQNELHGFDQFVLDGKRLVLQQGEELVPLPKKAILVLLALVQGPGIVLSRDEIITEVWGEQEQPIGDNTLDGYVHKIRRALGERPEGGEYIETVPRRGYRFAAKVARLNEQEAVPEVHTPPSGPIVDPEDSICESRPLLTDVSSDEHVTESLVSRLYLLRKVRAKALAGLAVAIMVGLSLWLQGSSQQSNLVINPDGSWTAQVPPRVNGITLEIEGKTFKLNAGDTVEIRAEGSVDIGRGRVGPDGEADYRDSTMDSPFKDRVGGLEMWIGTDKSVNRYFIGSKFEGSVKESGVPTFRVIESPNGYNDGNNSGAFFVTVKQSTPRRPELSQIIILSTPIAGQQFCIQLSGSGIDPESVRVVVTGRGCDNFGSCAVDNNVLHWYGGVTPSQVERVPLKLAPGDFEIFVQNGSNGERSNALPLVVAVN